MTMRMTWCADKTVLSEPSGRWGWLFCAMVLAALAGGTVPASADDLPGVTATEIKIGNTNAYSGPASAYGVIARAETAYFQMLNDNGGINGRKIDFMTLDDGYSPPNPEWSSCA